MKGIMDLDWNAGVRQIVSGFPWSGFAPGLTRSLARDLISFRRVSVFSFTRSYLHKHSKVFGTQDPERRETGTRTDHGSPGPTDLLQVLNRLRTRDEIRFTLKKVETIQDKVFLLTQVSSSLHYTGR